MILKLTLITWVFKSRDWSNYQKLSNFLTSEVKNVEKSLGHIEESLVHDETEDQLNSELNMVKLIMMLLSNTLSK